MKVVLFCGGYGMRMRDGESGMVKPMVPVGDRPLMWHVMRYYAHFGHRDFILALGFGAEHIARFFLDYQETHSNDFVLAGGHVTPLAQDIADWTITFVHTGLETPIGERLRRVREHLDGEEMFLANYADVLTDAPLDAMIDQFRASTAVASLMAVPPQSAFHVVDVGQDDRVRSIRGVATLDLLENGGYFIFRREIFDHLRPDVDLVGDTLTTLADQGRVVAFRHDGFWVPADTAKERAVLERLSRAERAPWEVWRDGRGTTASAGNGHHRNGEAIGAMLAAPRMER
ncbi:MAG: sugar phosphate nucleotidyltransferase [Nostocoides sp.]